MYCVYKLYIGDYYYTGSSKNLHKRMTKHKNDCYYETGDEYNSKKNKKIREICCEKCNFWDYVKVDIIERGIETKKEAEIRENIYINLKDPLCLNKQKAGQNSKNPDGSCNQDYNKNYYQENKQEIKKYQQEHKEEKKEYNEKYQQENKEKIKKQRKKYYQNNKEEIKEYTQKYQQNNKEKISENKKEYYQNNKEKISENKKKYYQNNKHFQCYICNTNPMTKSNYNKHLKTKKHKRNSKNTNEIIIDI